VIASLGYEHLSRHDLRHTGLTWMANTRVPFYTQRIIARHGDLTRHDV
jgi:integrase